MEDLILLFTPSIIIIANATAVLLFWFAAKGIFNFLSNIKEKLFGTHHVIIPGLGMTTYEERRNFDNKKISSCRMLDSFFPVNSVLKGINEVKNEK